MSDKFLTIRLRAEVADFQRRMAEVSKLTRDTAMTSEEAASKTSKASEKSAEASKKDAQAKAEQAAAAEKAGATLMTFGTAAVAGLGLAGKAAMDWESAWAGVTKTVDGTPEQMNALEESLRGLATTLPATHEEIAGVAEAAGQLGVKREDVVGFTETMIALGETTNLTADDAATAIAQISNVMGTMERDGSEGVERFSATLVALGNAGASTEAEIVSMAQRLAGAGKLIGASESDVLALANAMASVGIEAQLGGGVMSRVMQRMYGDVMKGGEGLENLAKVAGVSSKDFAAAFENDPVRAVDMMVQGLSRVKDEGGNVMDTMDGLGIKGTEETSVILRLAGAGDLLSDSLKLGDEAWKSNSALAAEAAKRYETTEAKVQIAWNNIKDAAIDAGAVLLPLIAGAAEGAADLAQAFGSLPDPVKGALTVLGGVGGVAALGAGAFLTLTPKVLDAMQAFDKLAPAGGRARGALVGVGKAAGGAMTLVALTTILAKLAESDYMSKIDTGMGKVADVLADVTANGPGAAASLDSLFQDRDGGNLIQGVEDLNTAMQRTFNKNKDQEFNDWAEGIIGAIVPVKGSSHILADSFDRIDQSFADMVSSGKPEDAAKVFAKIEAAAKIQGATVEELAAKFPQYGDALRAASADAKNAAAEGDNVKGSIEGAGNAAEVSAAQAEEIETALEDVGLAADGTVTDLVKFTDALINAGLLQLSARDAARGFEEAIDNMSESLATNGRTLDTTTAAGRANEAALDAIAGAGFRSAGAMAANGASHEALQGNLRTTYDRLVESARAFTDTDEEAIALARDIMKVPPGVNIDSWMDDEAKRMAEATAGALDKIDGRVVRTYTTNFIDTVRSDSVQPGTGAKRSGERDAFAVGGEIRGPGTGTSDSVPILASNGEHMLTAQEVRIMGGHDSVYQFRADLRGGRKIPGYAQGGAIGASVSATEIMMQHPTAAPSVSLDGLAVYVTNPFTGEQVRGVVSSIARQEANGAITAADAQSRFRRPGR
ncbi:phage tail tape measure protein [Arthrobacter sp. ISL-69]|uniref:phage tail tape measure protein n=1 Tax=Arthrobacter sp. ISL-69 TaxID=2819113 RepID=UPI001BE520BF|nr:phage tail tape measure protein [Arthrobacter sp. ISL-69]MBT2538676.1 phage tail tape measure protein [Arthrobacter sp. ISL-69]